MLIIEHENWEAWEVFRKCDTQWRVGFSGPYALDYSTVIDMMDIMGISDKVHTIERIKFIERGALAGFKRVEQTKIWPDETYRPVSLSRETLAAGYAR